MQRRFILFGLILWLSLGIFACTNTTTEQAKNTDASTISTSQQSQSVKRVVSLTSLSADIIYQLDSAKLVGISGSSLFKNDSRFKDIPRVSEGQATPNLEKIVALKPDLVIGAEGFSNLTTDKLKELGITTLLTKVDSWEGLQDLTKTLAKIVDADSTPLLNRYQSFVPDKPSQNPYTLVLVSRQPILSPSKKSWAGNLLEKFQAKNLTADLQNKMSVPGYVTLSAEKVLEANPDVLIVVSPQPGLLKSFKSESFWNQLKATKNNRVYEFDYYGLVNPGSVDAIEKACQQLKVALSG
ncbi:MAG: ABC transporter substrate-binding protein [Scytonema hyalinum WJT4-NPBG1]|nr:ABC transporter substrate-binding protein [Scytonema hyalinum WJT4-NPBG1]